MNSRISDYQLLPAIIEARFEDFCLDFFQELWVDEETQLVGKKGSGQNGVDICGQPNRGTDWFGAQCKNKEQLTSKQLTEREVNAEVEKAKKFNPKLKNYVIVTTATRNATIQELARTLTNEHRKMGLFDVKVYAWEDIVKKLIDKTPKTLAKWYPHLAMQETLPVEQISEVKKAQIEITEASDNVGNRVNVIGDNNIITISSDDAKSNKEDVYNAQIDTAKVLLDSHNPEKALEILIRLKTEIWTLCSDIAKFRIITNLGFGYSQINKYDEAARFFIEALQYNPVDEKALLNNATGFLLLNNKEEAKNKIEEVIKKNPLSARGWSLLLDTFDDNIMLGDIFQKIPKVLENDKTINTVLAKLAMARNNPSQAEKYLRIAINNSDRDAETQARLAEVLLQQVLNDEMVVYGGHVNESNKSRVIEVIELFDAAWSVIDKTETKKYRTSWLINRSMAKRLLDDKEGSFQDIELAIKTNPAGTEGVRAKAGLLFETGKQKEAIEWLESNSGSLENDPSLVFMLAGFLRETKQVDKSIEVLKALIERPNGETKNYDAKRMLIQLYLDNKDFDNAQKTLDLIPTTENLAVLNLIGVARIKSAQNLKEEAIENLLKAKKLSKETTSQGQKLELANALYFYKQYSDAADLFNDLVSDAEDDELTKKYLNALYRAGRYTNALDLAEKMKSKTGLTKYLVQIETAIYDEIGDPDKSESLCIEYLSEKPDDKDIIIRLAIVKLRLRKEDEIEDILSTIKNVEGIDMPQFSQLVNIYREIGKADIALNLAYELRRAFYSNPDAHLLYVSIFIKTEKLNEPLFEITRAIKDTYVELSNSQSKTIPYLLEERTDPNIRTGEITPENDIYNEIINKSIGDKIVLNTISGEELTVKVVKSKYVFAFQESLQMYNIHFPKANGMVGFTFDSSTPETTEASIQIFLKQVTALSDSIAPVEKAYQDGQITIGIFAELISKNPIDIFYGLMNHPDTPIRVALGTKEEIETSVSLIESVDQPKLIIDITSLISIHELGIEDKIIEGYGKLGITQSTIDLINETISEKKSVKSKGFATIGKNGSGFFREEITSEQVAKSIKYFEGIIEWIKSNCELVVSSKMPTKSFGEDGDMEKVLGKSFVDVLSIVVKKEYILFTDDERFRSYCKSEYGIDGIWSQFVLSELLSKSILTHEEYIDSVIKLIGFNFVHISISKDVIYRAGKQVDWEINKQPFSKVISLLGESYTSQGSSILVSSEFLSLIWLDKAISSSKRDEIAKAVLKAIGDKRDKITVLAMFQLAITRLPLLDVRIKEEIREFINVFIYNYLDVSQTERLSSNLFFRTFKK